jgi:hypothetical protein
MANPHSRGQSFAADIAKRQNQAFIRFVYGEEIAGQVTHCEDLARNVERFVMNGTRRAQTSMHLRGFEDRGVQFGILPLKHSDFVFELA